jgi:acetoin utilization protein AcuB
MKIKTLMVSSPIIIQEGTSIEDAIVLMKENRIRHLPVVDRKEKLIGWVTLSDLKQGLMPSMLGDVSLSDLVNRSPITVSPDDDIEVAAKLIYQHKISGMPVVNDGELAGVITETDLFRAFIDMMGILTASSRLDVVVNESADSLQKVLQVIQENGADIISIGHTPLPEDRRVCYFRLRPCKTAGIKENLEARGFEVLAALD